MTTRGCKSATTLTLFASVSCVCGFPGDQAQARGGVAALLYMDGADSGAFPLLLPFWFCQLTCISSLSGQQQGPGLSPVRNNVSLSPEKPGSGSMPNR